MDHILSEDRRDELRLLAESRDAEMLRFLGSWFTTEPFAKKDVRRVRIHSKTKKRLVLSNPVITLPEPVPRSDVDIDELYDFLVKHGAQKVRRKRKRL